MLEDLLLGALKKVLQKIAALQNTTEISPDD